MLSILIPTYNTEVVALVMELAKQLQELDFPSEIMVLDDASNQPHILEANEALRTFKGVSYFTSEKNMGRTAARTLLAQKAHYNYLLFLDADVQPKHPNFLSCYSDFIQDSNSIIVGGIEYEKDLPEKDKMLRYRYGKARESKSALTRNKTPHIIVSANILFQKNVFLEINKDMANRYGLDLLLSEKIKQLNNPVKHIDNPVIHLGLENSTDFLKKSKNALQTLISLETENKISKDAYPIQRAYGKLKKFKLLGLFNWLMSLFQKSIRHNLLSGKPSVFLFNLYRLHHYTQLKKASNA